MRPETVPSLGKIRRLDRLCDEAGHIRAAALDHPENYLALLDADVDSVPFADVVDSKARLIESLSPHASALLLDPVWSLGQGVYSGIVPRSVGLVASLEKLSYAPTGSPVGWRTDLTLREEWSAQKVATLGGDGVKVVVFYRDEEGEVSATKRKTIADLARQCAELQIPLVVEPLWFPLPDEDSSDPQVIRRRFESVVTAATTFADVGADIIKSEFPGSVATVEDQTVARERCAELDDGLSIPWVLLSAGVGYESFVKQVRIAGAAGASGFMAGRAIWGDAVGPMDRTTRRQRIETACARMDELSEIIATTGSPANPHPSLRSDILPPDWHTSYLA